MGYVLANVFIVQQILGTDWSERWSRFGDSPAYWTTVFAEMEVCQFMIHQAFIVLVIAGILSVILRRRVLVMATVLALGLYVFVAAYNLLRLWPIASGVGV